MTTETNAERPPFAQVLAANLTVSPKFFQNASGTGFANNFNTDLTKLTNATSGPLNAEVTQNEAEQQDLTTTINNFEGQLTAQSAQLTAQYDAVNFPAGLSYSSTRDHPDTGHTEQGTSSSISRWSQADPLLLKGCNNYGRKIFVSRNRRGSASPMRLVICLYEQAIEDLRRALLALEKGDIEDRTRHINHALLVISHLQGTLDMERGGEVARNLARFYTVVRAGLLEAQLKQSAKILEQQTSQLATVHEAWLEVERITAVPAPQFPPSRRAAPALSEPQIPRRRLERMMPSRVQTLRVANRRIPDWLDCAVARHEQAAVATPERMSGIAVGTGRAGEGLRAEPIPEQGVDPELDDELQ